MPNDKKLKAFISQITRELGSNADAILKAFTTAMYSNAQLNDLKLCDAEALAAMARLSLESFKTHIPGRSKMRIINPDIAGLAERTVIEITNDDMPFLLNSVLVVLKQQSHEILLVLHPIIASIRTKTGAISKIVPSNTSRDEANVVRKSYIQIHLRKIETAKERKVLQVLVNDVLDQVRLVVTDRNPMQGALNNLIRDYKNMPPPLAVEELTEALEFLRWLLDDNFIFMGIRTFDFKGQAGKANFKTIPKAGLGILRNPAVRVLRRGRKLASYTPELIEFMGQAAPIIITKANVRTMVHRQAYLDYIGVKRFDDNGRLLGELRIVGLFTSTVYTRSPRGIPMLRRKLKQVIKLSRFNPEGHSGKALLNVLETYPRDELFQINPKLLSEIADGIMQLDKRPRPRIFVRADKFDRFASILAYLPRDRYTSDVRTNVGAMLAQAYEGVVSVFSPWFPEGVMVRVHYIIGHRGEAMPRPDPKLLEQRMIEITRTWDDLLSEALHEQLASGEAVKKKAEYTGAFSASYQEAYEPCQAILDIERIETLKDGGDIALVFYRPNGTGDNRINLKLYHLGDPIKLSDRLPILEGMDLKAIDERTFTIRPPGASYVLHDISLQTADASPVDIQARGRLLEDAFQAVWSGAAENDGYNGLVLRAGLSWRQVVLLRALGRYLRQAGIPFGNRYLWQALVNHKHIATDLWALFEARFSAGAAASKSREVTQAKLVHRIETALTEVASLNDDRIVRRFLNLICSSVRTNFYQSDKDGSMRPTIAIKIDSDKIDELPEPHPYREIFVYAPDVEGIHMRFGPIARGGLRWSDRTEDFRTEVLGLVKAQQVKNAVIVPVGSKGGFVPKKLSPAFSREEFLAEGVRCYKLFVASLVQITDNLKDGKVRPPAGVVCHDGNDPYLVVAADKGTATFSDIANGISEEHGFWLADAFASGGSAGYDHKKMAITARGCWEAVKRHFRELDTNIQKEPFTVIGCGDMSGDVFGNGMLLSKTMKLIGAFDHRDIFIDPNPDPASSWKERKRLFEMPRSSWQNYNEKYISEGGGVFARSLKTIPLSPQMRAMTGLDAKTCTPDELVQGLLKAPCDLLWFGGIGTYVRASDETDADVGDRANDGVRITAPEIRAKVVGEGANLGLTQLARIQFNLLGGSINSDAIDNSGGVNSSDMEVNIKIALSAGEQAGKLSRKMRNQFLEKMTDEVARLVLRNNYLQTLALTMAQHGGEEENGYLIRLMQTLEVEGELNRAVEYLPDNMMVEERLAADQALTRPEIAVLMAYSKLLLFKQLMDSDVAEEPYFRRELSSYFPAQMQKRYADEIYKHRLRAEIISTVLANNMINFTGPSFIARLMRETGVDAANLARAFTLANDVLELVSMHAQVDGLDNKIASNVQLELYEELQASLRRQMTWFAQNGNWSKGLRPVAAHYRKELAELALIFPKVLIPTQQQRISELSAKWTAEAVPAELATRIAELRFLSRGSDIVLVATCTKKPLKEVARAMFTMAQELGIDQIVARATQMSASDYYDRVAANRAVDSVFVSLRKIVLQIYSSPAKGKQSAIELWTEANSASLAKANCTIEDMVCGSDFTLARLTLAANALAELSAGR